MKPFDPLMNCPSKNALKKINICSEEIEPAKSSDWPTTPLTWSEDQTVPRDKAEQTRVQSVSRVF